MPHVPSEMKLPTEIWEQIIVLTSSIDDLKNVSLVNRHFYDLARPLLWNSVRLTVKIRKHLNRTSGGVDALGMHYEEMPSDEVQYMKLPSILSGSKSKLIRRASLLVDPRPAEKYGMGHK